MTSHLTPTPTGTAFPDNETHGIWLRSSTSPNPTVAIIDFPMPPSVNGIWKRGRHGVYLSDRYQTWKRVFDNIILATRPRPKITGPFVATITLSEKKRRKNSDADNRVKVVLDALQRCGIIENDSLAESVTVRWGVAPEGASVSIFPALVPGDNSKPVQRTSERAA